METVSKHKHLREAVTTIAVVGGGISPKVLSKQFNASYITRSRIKLRVKFYALCGGLTLKRREQFRHMGELVRVMNPAALVGHTFFKNMPLRPGINC